MSQTVISRGFGLLQRIITRGFFSSDEPPPASPDCFVGGIGAITDVQAVVGVINGAATAENGLINDAPTAKVGLIHALKAANGLINDAPTADVGAVTDTAGFQGAICGC